MQLQTTRATSRHYVRINRNSLTDSRTISPAQMRLKWEDAVSVFISDLQVRKSSRESYKRAVIQFFKWVEQTGRELGTMTRADILEYSDYLEQRTTSTKTRCLYLVSVRRFYEWSESYKLYPNIAKDVKIRADKSDEFLKRPLTDEQARAFLDYFYDKKDSSSSDLRDYAIVYLMLCTGLRTIEVSRLQICDICQDGGEYLLKVWGKGRDRGDKDKDFQVLDSDFISVISDYIKTREDVTDESYLFVSASRNNKGGQLTTRAISAICKDGLKAIGLDSREYTAHSLRHTVGTGLLLDGVPMDEIRKVLRHKDIATTEKYVRTVERWKRIETATEKRLFNKFKR